MGLKKKGKTQHYSLFLVFKQLKNNSKIGLYGLDFHLHLFGTHDMLFVMSLRAELNDKARVCPCIYTDIAITGNTGHHVLMMLEKKAHTRTVEFSQEVN